MCILKIENYSIGMKRGEPGSLELFPLAYLPKPVDLFFFFFYFLKKFFIFSNFILFLNFT